MSLHTLSFQSAAVIAYTLAELELSEARALCAKLPTEANHESHLSIGLAIGDAGKRIRNLVEAADDHGMSARQGSCLHVLESVSQRDDEAHDTPGTPSSLYAALGNLIRGLWPSTNRLMSALQACDTQSSGSPLYGVSARALVSATQVLSQSTTHARSTRRTERATRCPERARRAYGHKLYDSQWRIGQVDTQLPIMPKLENLEGLLQKLHHTAFRESVASEICAMNMFEYDAMPWRFYVDMCEQTADEAHHSQLCLQRLAELGGAPGDYLLPYLGNYYEMFWEMDLEERLVAMNLDTEAEGRDYLQDAAYRLRRIGDTRSAALMEQLSMDERRHARFGAIWLGYLNPNQPARRSRVQSCRAMTAISLASAHTARAGGTVQEAIGKWLREGAVLKFSPTSEGEEEEEEIGLTAAWDQALVR